MKLSNEGLKNSAAWKEKGYSIPAYNREEMMKKTKENPVWIHFGNGNLFKAFQANVVERLLNKNLLDKGIITAENDVLILENNRKKDLLVLLATLKANGTVEKTVVGSIAESVLFQPEAKQEYNRMKEIFAAPSLQMVSFTITEKGYSLLDASGSYKEEVEKDFQAGPHKACSYFGKITGLLYERFRTCAKPLALVSMDNCSHNGDVLKHAVMAYVQAWIENGLAETDFLNYVEANISFPWTMIDKITPRPDKSVEAMFKADGIEDLTPLVSSRGSLVAPFVNAEETEYLVIEDDFPNGRPALEKGGIIFCDRATVNQVETMKVTTCLNPLHTALAIFGCLLGYERIADEMKDETLVKLIKNIGYKEGLPVVADPKILDPKAFIDTVIEVRLPNPFMPDAPQRIAMDTSQKLPVRFGKTIRSYIESDSLDVQSLEAIPMVYAGWLRYLMQIDDQGNAFEASSDPMLEKLTGLMKDIRLGDVIGVEDVEEILRDESIFSLDLVEAGLADKVVAYFNEMNAAPGAIGLCLEKALDR
jgi:fructuronate reductase